MRKVTDLADQINKDVESFKYFWATGLIKETKLLWRQKENMKLLNPIAQTIAKHYSI